ncbi:hypothetical protein DSECCO2_602210 [anaerobic digester metagenome]|mgnify:CR=1 FL=1
MPYLDRTGPLGDGPRGRGMGPCRAGGPGLGMGRERRGGFGRCFRSLPDGPEQDIEKNIQMEITALEARLKAFQERSSKIKEGPQ